MDSSKGMTSYTLVSSAGTSDLHLLNKVTADDNYEQLGFTLSELIDIEVYKVEEMVKCLEDLERMLEPARPNNQTTTESEQTTGVIDNQVM